MMQSRLSGSPCYYINLQIIHGTLQVKTPREATSLGFKQMAQGLHANWMSFGRHSHVMAPAARSAAALLAAIAVMRISL
jgi:hypothetical protein